MDLNISLAYDEKNAILQLFNEYADSILAEGRHVAECLNAQNYGDEINSLEEKYGLPEGRLFIASVDHKPAGCVALRKINNDICEIKRLYVKPGNRGKHIGKKLMEQAIEAAKEIGYKHIRLDTFPFMKEAIAMYENYGFYKIEKYNDNPAPTAIFMQLDL